MALKSFFVVIVVLGMFDACWCTKRAANCSEQTPVELSCHRSLYQNGLLWTRERVSIQPQIEDKIYFQLASNGDLESSLACTDGLDTVTVAFFRIRGEILTCSCLKKFCKVDRAFIESSRGDNGWESKKTLFEQYSKYFQLTTKMDRNMEGFYQCQLVLRDELTNNSLHRNICNWVGTGIGMLTVFTITLAIVCIHWRQKLRNPEDPEE